MSQTKLGILISAMTTALATNPQDEKALAQKEVSEAYEEFIYSISQKNAKTYDDQVTMLKEKDDRIAELELELEEANAKIAKLTNQPAEKVCFSHGGSEYEVIAKRLNIPGHGMVTAADVAASEELQYALVQSQSGLIRKKA